MWAQSAIEVGRIVAAARRHRGFTQAQLAAATGVAQNWISEIERGKDTAQIGKVLRLLAYLGVRLKTGETPWSEPAAAGGKAYEAISLADVIAAHSTSPPSAPRKRAKAISGPRKSKR